MLSRPISPARFWPILLALILTAIAVFASVYPTPAGAAVAKAAPSPSFDDQLDALIKAAQVSGSPVLLTAGHHALARPHVLDGVDLVGTGGGCVLDVSGLPAGAAALTVRNTTGDNARPRLSGFRLVGPGRLSLGKRTAGCDGIRVECQAALDHVRAEGFDCGLVAASVGGHVFCRDCTLTNNYYNWYLALGGGNYLLDGCYLDGAGMASIGMPYDQGVEALRVVSTHLGYAPYGVYQEPTPAGKTPGRLFLADAEFDQAWFEQIGMAAFKSCWAGVDNGPRCEFRDVSLKDIGYTSGPGFALPGAAPEPATVIGDYMSDGFIYEPGNHPFGPGASGKVFGFQRYNGVSGNAQQVAPSVRIGGVTPAAMP